MRPSRALTPPALSQGTTSVAEAAQRAISRANAKNGASLSFGSIKVRAEGGSGAAKLDAALEDVIPVRPCHAPHAPPMFHLLGKIHPTG